MILNRTPLTIAEVKSYAGETLSENKVLADYIKSFEKLSEEKAKSLVEDIKALKNPKIKEDMADRKSVV